MKMGISDLEGALLHDLLEHASGDIVLKISAAGFVEQGAEALAGMGMDVSQMLFAPHLADLADRSHSGLIKRHFENAMNRDAPSGWLEFPVSFCGHSEECSGGGCRGWFALNLRRLVDDEGVVRGALGLLRSIDRVRKLEDELFANALTDPLTGLVNRRVFLGRLRGELQDGPGGYLVLLAIDRMRALQMQYGQRTADEVNWGFAKFLQAMALPGIELAQLDGERFAVILSGMARNKARGWVEDLLKTFSSLALSSSAKSPRLTASAGLAMIEKSVDWTMREGELALVMARAGGGSQLAFSDHLAASQLREGIANCNAPHDELGDRSRRR